MSKLFRIASLNVKTFRNWQHEHQNLLGLLAWMSKPVWTANLNVKIFQDCQPECQNLSGLPTWMSKPFRIVSLNVKIFWDCQLGCQSLTELPVWMSKFVRITSLNVETHEIASLNVKTCQNCQPQCQNLNPGIPKYEGVLIHCSSLRFLTNISYYINVTWSASFIRRDEMKVCITVCNIVFTYMKGSCDTLSLLLY
jgi:hypothetical protein